LGIFPSFDKESRLLSTPNYSGLAGARGSGGGFHIALVPADPLPEQVEAALDDLGTDAAAVLELSEWKTSGSNVAVAYVPGLEEK
jgi:hypothetical protein